MQWQCTVLCSTFHNKLQIKQKGRANQKKNKRRENVKLCVQNCNECGCERMKNSVEPNKKGTPKTILQMHTRQRLFYAQSFHLTTRFYPFAFLTFQFGFVCFSFRMLKAYYSAILFTLHCVSVQRGEYC